MSLSRSVCLSLYIVKKPEGFSISAKGQLKIAQCLVKPDTLTQRIGVSARIQQESLVTRLFPGVMKKSEGFSVSISLSKYHRRLAAVE